MLPYVLGKDGVDEWTALLAIIVEKYRNLCATIGTILESVCLKQSKNVRRAIHWRWPFFCALKHQKNCGTHICILYQKECSKYRGIILMINQDYFCCFKINVFFLQKAKQVLLKFCSKYLSIKSCLVSRETLF